MDIKTLDFIFPFFVFFYGLLLVFVLETPALQKIATQRRNSQVLSDIYAQMQSHKWLAWTSFYVGGLWSLQNLWFA